MSSQTMFPIKLSPKYTMGHIGLRWWKFSEHRRRKQSWKSCESSSSGKIRAIQFPQNRNVCIKCWCGMIKPSNLECLSSIHSPQSSISNSKSSILHPPTSNLFIQPHFSIFKSSFSILSQMYRIFGSKCPQNSVISDKMSVSTACSFFQVCFSIVLLLKYLQHQIYLNKIP